MTQTATLTEFAKRTFFEMMKDVATSIPGHVIAFDPSNQHAQIQIGVVRIDVNGKEFAPPPLIEVPVYFPGGKWAVEYQIDPNDEGIILFSQRCIEGWLATGGVGNQPFVRFHDLNDAMFLPGMRSQPNVLTDFANDGIRIRNEDGTQYVWLKGDGTIESENGAVTDTLNPDGSSTRTNGIGTIQMLSDGTVNINGAIFAPTGAITSPVSVGAPTISAATSLTVDGKEQKDHTHLPGTYNIGGTPVTGNSGAPV